MRIIYIFVLNLFIVTVQKLKASNKVTIPEVCTQLRMLDDSLVKLIETLPNGGGNKLLKDLEKYNDASARFLHFLFYEKEEATEVGQDLIKEKEPKFSKLNIDYYKFKTKFKWTDSESKKFKELRMKILDKWNTVNLLNIDYQY